MSHWDNEQKDPRMEMAINNMKRVANQRDKYEQALRDIKKHLELGDGDLAKHSTVYRIACMALAK